MNGVPPPNILTMEKRRRKDGKTFFCVGVFVLVLSCYQIEITFKIYLK